MVFESKKTKMQEFYRLIAVHPSTGQPQLYSLSDTESSLLMKENDKDNYFGEILDSKHQIIIRSGQQTHVGIARLDSGGIQFYYNYRIVE
jgi:hypothetical protein